MLSIHTDRALIRAEASSTRYVLARISAPRAPEREDRLPVNVSFVLDRSGSMGDERKFTLAREAVQQALRMLRPQDRFSLVVYDTQIDVLAESTLATSDARRRALDALDAVGPRGGTDLGAGWLRGCEQLAEFATRQGVSRCLLLTDGLANHGIVDPDELSRHASALRARGVSTSTFGVGADFDERLLRDMAHEGGGNFYFIEGAAQIPEILTAELGEALEVTLPRASLVVHPAGEERVEVLNRFRHRRDAGRNEFHVELGDLVSAQELDVVLKVRFPRGRVNDTAGIAIELRSEGEAIHGAAGRQQWTYASHRDNDIQLRDNAVDRVVAELYAARARAEATEANRDGRFDHARRVLERTAERILQYAGNDPELRRLSRQLRADLPRYAEAPMAMMELKASFYDAEVRSKSRSPGGRARRSL